MINNFIIHDVDRQNLLTRINNTIDIIKELIDDNHVDASDWIYDYKSYHTYASHLSALKILVEQFDVLYPQNISCNAEWLYYFEKFSDKVLRTLERLSNGW